MIVGEFSGAMTDCAKWLNGRGRGARYDGTYDGSPYIGSCAGLSTGTVAGLSSTMKANIGKFAQAQMSQYTRYGGGWIWWTCMLFSPCETLVDELFANWYQGTPSRRQSGIMRLCMLLASSLMPIVSVSYSQS